MSIFELYTDNKSVGYRFLIHCSVKTHSETTLFRDPLKDKRWISKVCFGVIFVLMATKISINVFKFFYADMVMNIQCF